MPSNDQPEQIAATNPDWDTANQRFNLSLTSQLSNAGSSVSGVFKVRGTTTVTTDTGKTFELKAEQALEVIEVDSTNRARINPLRTAWDRDGGAVTGTVKVQGTVALLNPAGNTIDTDTFEGSVVVG